LVLRRDNFLLTISTATAQDLTPERLDRFSSLGRLPLLEGATHLVGLDLPSALAADMSMAIVAPASALPLNGRAVLLLEDNLIVALEAEDMLRGLGAASIHTASTVAMAARFVASITPDFAVLDVNLGFETSLEFAATLRELEIPFIFASGYGDNIDIGGANSAVITISKPYDRDNLTLAVVRTLANSVATRPHT
jgi:CheY-like chemotaxis protein